MATITVLTDRHPTYHYNPISLVIRYQMAWYLNYRGQLVHRVPYVAAQQATHPWKRY